MSNRWITGLIIDELVIDELVIDELVIDELLMLFFNKQRKVYILRIFANVK